MAPTHAPLTAKIVRKVAAEEGIDPTDLPPLFDGLDPDALNQLFRATSPEAGGVAGKVEFTTHGYRIIVENDRQIQVHPTATPSDRGYERRTHD